MDALHNLIKGEYNSTLPPALTISKKSLIVKLLAASLIKVSAAIPPLDLLASHYVL